MNPFKSDSESIVIHLLSIEDVLEMEKKKHISLAFIGNSGVGKTTIIKLLNEKIEGRGSTYELSTEEIMYTIWEFQTASYEPEKLGIFSISFLEQSSPYNRFVIIVSDSTRDDVGKITYSLKFLRKTFPNTRLAIIANKQDLENRIPAKQIEQKNNVPTLDLSAKNQTNRNRLISFISYLIDSDTGL